MTSMRLMKKHTIALFSSMTYIGGFGKSSSKVFEKFLSLNCKFNNCSAATKMDRLAPAIFWLVVATQVCDTLDGDYSFRFA